MALLLKPDGTTEDVLPQNGSDFTLEEAQKLVGGYVEYVPPAPVYGSDQVLLINEDGLVQDLPENELASYAAGCRIVGPMLVCAPGEFR